MSATKTIAASGALLSLLVLSGCAGTNAPDTAPPGFGTRPAGAVISAELPPPVDLGGLRPSAPARDTADTARLSGISDTIAIAGLPIDPDGIAGGWTLSSQGESCQLFLSTTPWTGGFRASLRGCPAADIAAVNAWRIDGNRLVLLDGNGMQLAELRATSAERLLGRGRGGNAIDIFRAGVN